MNGNILNLRYLGQLAAIALVTGMSLSNFAAAADTRQKWTQDYEKGCEKGQMQECLNLAVAHARGEFNGRKTEKNVTLSKQFSTRAIEVGTAACRQGNLKNCYMLGVMYFEGELVATDYAKGIDYARKSCVGGYKEACEWLKNSGVQ